MSADDDETVGPKHQPKDTRWKKGQCGNPHNKKAAVKSGKTQGQIVEEIFAEKLGEDGKRTVFEAIQFQLCLKVAKGSRGAMKVLRKYQAYARSKPEYVLLTDEDTENAAEEYRKLIENLPDTPGRSYDPNQSPIEAADEYRALLQEGQEENEDDEF